MEGKDLTDEPMLIRHDNTISTVFPKDLNHGFSLEELYKMLECDTIATYPVHQHTHIMVVDDNAKLVEGWEKKINILATQLYKEGRMTRSEFSEYLEMIRGQGIVVSDLSGADPSNSVVGNVLITTYKYFK